MQTQTIELRTPDGPMRCYEATPDAPKAAIVVLQEGLGVTDYVREVTRRVAGDGYYAVAPHLYHRAGEDDTADPTDRAKALALARTLTDRRALADVDAALQHLADAGWATEEIGIVGFCLGGRVSFLASANRRLGAGVGFYGGGIVTSQFSQWPAIVHAAPYMPTPWLGLFGDQDAVIPVADVELLQDALRQAAVDTAIVRYRDAGHGFHNHHDERYHESAAKDAEVRMFEWFTKHLFRPSC